jgi:AraC family transcriptional regulator, regulatory protein of adaptative response / methylated-DNA-[protein]-cysteine methyltransferase
MHASRAYTIADQVLTHLRTHPDQSTLTELARHLALSPFSIQKAFRQAVGLSPNQFNALISVQRASFHLRNRDCLHASLDAAISSPGRLHDRFVRIEAMSPGEWKSDGNAITIKHGQVESPLGTLQIVWTTRGIHRLGFVDAEPSLLTDFIERWPRATLNHCHGEAQEMVHRIFAPLDNHPLTLAVFASHFQIAVWRALLALAPDGSTTTYGRISSAIGQPKAARVVGQAVGANPIAILIPCHRVLRDSGALGGYRWSPNRKACLLARESAGTK